MTAKIYGVDSHRNTGGIWFRAVDDNSGYVLYLTNGPIGKMVLAKLVDGKKLEEIKSRFFPFSIVDPKPHVFKAIVKGSHIACYVDGCLMMEVDDQTFSYGSAGLFSPNAWMRYDNFTISSK